MQKSFVYKLFAALTLLVTLFNAAASELKPVLVVVTSHGEPEGQRPGYEFDELAKTYLVFKANNVDVDIASPKGGAVIADEYDAKKAFNQLVLEDAIFSDKLANTLPLAKLNAKNYSGVFVIGGKGAMFDLPYDTHLQSLIANIYEQKGSIGAVCHGPAALVNVQLSDDSWLVAGKSVNSFTNEEEQLFGKKWAKEFDFMLQDKLIERGAKFQHSPIMLNHVATDGRLITGQNPTSTSQTAIAFVRSLGITPAPYSAFEDERTLALVESILENDTSAESELNNNLENYHAQLLGMYGFYYLMSAKSQEDIGHALTLMEATRSSINHPMLDLQIVKGYQKSGNLELAKQNLATLLKTHPDNEAAKAMAKELL